MIISMPMRSVMALSTSHSPQLVFLEMDSTVIVWVLIRSKYYPAAATCALRLHPHKQLWITLLALQVRVPMGRLPTLMPLRPTPATTHRPRPLILLPQLSPPHRLTSTGKIIPVTKLASRSSRQLRQVALGARLQPWGLMWSHTPKPVSVPPPPTTTVSTLTTQLATPATPTPRAPQQKGQTFPSLHPPVPLRSSKEALPAPR